MTNLSWDYDEGFSLGPANSPYTTWFEVIGKHSQGGFPGDRNNLPERWIVDRTELTDAKTPWTSEIAKLQLNDIRIEKTAFTHFWQGEQAEQKEF